MALTPKRALLLGMVYSEEMQPKRGQEFRDRVRCAAMERRRKWDVYTLDNKHDEEGSVPGKHCRANFADSRRMIKAIRDTWGQDITFDAVILDYFFCPAGWAKERWSDKFFRESLPLLAKEGLLPVGGKVWLPYLRCVEESLKEFKQEIDSQYTVQLVKEKLKNPLFAATEFVEEELDRCPDSLTNLTQIKPLVDYSNTPFCALEVIPRVDIVKTVAKSPRRTVSLPAAVVSPSRDSKWTNALRARTCLRSTVRDLFEDETFGRKKRSISDVVERTKMNKNKVMKNHSKHRVVTRVPVRSQGAKKRKLC